MCVSVCVRVHAYTFVYICNDHKFVPLSDSDVDSGTVMVASRSSRGKKMPVKVIDKWKEGIEGAESPLNKARRRIVYFLGALGGQINTSLVESESAAAYAAKAVAWDSKNRLEFALPFQDMKPSLYLGKSTSNLACKCHDNISHCISQIFLVSFFQ